METLKSTSEILDWRSVYRTSEEMQPLGQNQLRRSLPQMDATFNFRPHLVVPQRITEFPWSLSTGWRRQVRLTGSREAT